MTSYEQICLLIKLLENKDRYIEMSGNDEKLIELYNQLEKARLKYADNMHVGIVY